MAAYRPDEFLDTLSETPRKHWSSGLLYHGARVVLLLGLALMLQFLFPAATMPDFPALEKGMVPEEDLIAQVDFPLPKSEEELEQERTDVARSVVPIFYTDTTAVSRMLGEVRGLMTYVDSAAEAGGTDLTERTQLRDVLISYGLRLDNEALTLLRSPTVRNNLRRALEAAVRTDLPRGYALSTELEQAGRPQIRIVGMDGDRLMTRDSVPTQMDFFARAERHLPANPPSALEEAHRLALIRFFQPTIRYDETATNTAIQRARDAVPTTKGTILRGERVVAAHEQVTDEGIERWRAYQDFLLETGALGVADVGAGRQIGGFILNLALLSIFGLLLYFYRPVVYQNYRHVLLLTLLVAVLFTAAAIISGAEAPVELVPIAFPALVVAMLWDGRMALNLTLVLAIALAAQSPFLSLSSRILLIVGGAAAALSVRVVRRRAQGLMLGTFIALAYAVSALALGLLRAQPFEEVLLSVGWGAVNGIATALLALGFMPLFETFTKITTDQTLLELADLNRPLLKRLSLEASGTYAHSINVANLAEAAARAIDANALLVRVGAYYHDVGKMAAPQYFIENQARGRNPHDQLDAATSAALVRSHVLEGIRLADQAGLPDSVRCFIPEHHGTQCIAYFLDRARKNADGATVDANDYSYEGPRPQSKETAILMMADSVESAAKVLLDPTPERLREMVDRIVDGKIAEGQLEEAPLTMREITTIKEQFVTILMGMYHHRIDYPPQPRPQTAGAGAASDTRTDGHA